MEKDPGGSAALFLTLITGLASAAAGFAAEPLEVVSRVHPSQVSDTPADAARPPHSPPPPVSLSADGRYAVFLSRAVNLVPGQNDVNGSPSVETAEDVFIKDLVTGTVTLVSHSLVSPATTGNRGSSEAVISADGRYVAFISAATDLVSAQEEGHRFFPDYDVLLWDRITGATTLVAATKQELGLFLRLGDQRRRTLSHLLQRCLRPDLRPAGRRPGGRLSLRPD